MDYIDVFIFSQRSGVSLFGSYKEGFNSLNS